MNLQLLTLRFRSTLTLLISTFACCSIAGPKENLKPFPPAQDGMERFVIFLPHKERGEEEAFKVSLTVGKVMMTDGVNQIRLGGKIEAKNLEGWGFTFYEVPELGPGMSTRIGVPPGNKGVKKFVAGPTTLINYNSRIPIVVYLPKGTELRYRIWTAGEETAAEKD